MATLKMPTVEGETAASDFETLPSHTPLTIPPDSSIKPALAILLEGLEYAQQLGAAPWDFAVEVSSLRRLKLSNNDLRWLLAHELVEHAVEVTVEDAARSFRKQAANTISKRSCFVLTDTGVAVARELRGDEQLGENRHRDRTAVRRAKSKSSESAVSLPCWDRNRRELWFGATLVKRFTLPSPDQESILTAFEEQHWPPRIDDPALTARDTARRTQLLETVQQLNRRHRSTLIRFQCDGGRGIFWHCGETPAKRNPLPLPASVSSA
jgi:hypothetical protein